MNEPLDDPEQGRETVPPDLVKAVTERVIANVEAKLKPDSDQPMRERQA